MKIKSHNLGNKTKFLIFIVTTLLIVFMFPRGESLDFQVSEGMIWIQEDIIAPFSFPILKDAAIYESELKQAENSVFPVYIKKEFSLSDTLNKFHIYLIEVINENLKKESRDFINPTFFTSESFSKLLSLYSGKKQTLQKESSLKLLFNTVDKIILPLHNQGILNTNSGEDLKDTIALRIGNTDLIRPISKYLYYDQAKKIVFDKIRQLNLNQDVKKILEEYSSNFIIPNIIYDDIATKLEIEQAKSSVSRYSGFVSENERIVAKHDRITKQVKLKIDSYREIINEYITVLDYGLQFLGKFFHVISLLAILGLYLYLFRKKIYDDNRSLTLIASLYLLVSFITYIINSLPIDLPLEYLIFIPAVSMIITITFDSRLGFYSTVILAMIIGALRGNDYSFMASNFVAAALSVYSVRNIKNRSQIFRSFILILIGYCITILSFGLERFATFNSIATELGIATLNAILSPILTNGLLIFIERIFKITTDLTLWELTDYEKPLLKQLATKTPGTFNHTLIVSYISEAAAEKIQCNSLLSKVGALYHDIGKTINPEAYIENQHKDINIHNSLAPEKSVKLLINHIDKGIELAKDYNLPQEVIDFIPMHHGTTVISYFFEKAKKIYGKDEVNIDEYRYKGPKPNSKETAVVMLADSCESAVRSISEPNEEKIKNVINNIINYKLADNQLDESPLTLSDIKQIKETFFNILLKQNYKRIKYPKQDELEQEIKTDIE